MKTLVFFGSAREKGHTRAMLDLFLRHLDGEKEIIDAYHTEVSPCKDCRYCWNKKGCSIMDGMQEIYQKIEEADNIIFASPMYFHSISGQLKTMIDRLQLYWAGEVRGDKREEILRKGVILMTGGAPSFEKQFLGGQLVLHNLLHDLSTELLGEICFPNTDVDSLDTRNDIAGQIMELAKKMNQEGEKKEI